MADPAKLRPLTPQMEDKAREQQQHALTHSGALMIGATNALTVAALVSPKTAGKLGHYGLGFEIKPLGRSAPTIRPTAFTKLYALPPPLGIVPPEYYGASPTYLGDLAPWLPKSPFLATSTTPEREAVHLAKVQREKLENEVLGLISSAGHDRALRWHVEIGELPQYLRVQGTELEFTTRILERELRFAKIEFPNLGFITEAEANALTRPPIAPVLDEFPGVGTKPQPVAPQRPQPVAQNVPDPTYAVELQKAINTAMQASKDAADGVNKSLLLAWGDP